MEFTEALTGIIVSVSFFAAIILPLYFYLKTRNRERMLMIEKGLQAPKKDKKDKRLSSLKYGIFIVGISLGIFLGYFLTRLTTIHEVVCYFTMILLFGGIALIFNFFLEGKLMQGKTNG